MTTLYLNHGIIEAQSEQSIIKFLKEIVILVEKVRENHQQLLVYNQFWDIPTSIGPLRNIVYKLNDRDEVKSTILAIMGVGPYYYDDDVQRVLNISPYVDITKFGKKLIEICFKDRRDLVLSLTGELILNNPIYTVSENYDSIEIKNITGQLGLQYFIQSSIQFNSIEDVFDQIEFNNIVILDNAKKSSKRHDFQGRFSDVFDGMVALDIELQLLKEGVPAEVRKKTYFQETGFEISEESSKTLGNEKYRKEREIVVPNMGKKLFEWHIKIGNQTRIHYFIDTINSKIYIGHCGKHLGTSSYNS